MRSPLVATLFVAFAAGCSSDKSPDNAGGAAGMSTLSGGTGGSTAGAGTGGSMGGNGAGGTGGDAAGGMSAAGAGALAGAGMSGAGGAAAGAGGTAAGGGAAAGASGAAGGAGAPAAGCIVPKSATDQPMLLSATGCVDPADPKQAAPSLIAYDVNSPLWSDGAVKERYVSLPPGGKIHVKDCTAEPDTCMPVESGGTGEDDGHWGLPVGTVLMKVFIVGDKRIETRLITRRNESTWIGYSYEWNDDETDATLLPDQKDKPVGSQTWHYPSPSECLQCHTEAGGRSLGPTTAQMNRDHDYADGTMNQVDKFAALGLFDTTPPKIDGYPDPKGMGDLEARARSYLQANCSICHRPGGTVSDVDLRYVTPFKNTSLCNQMVNMGTGDPNVPQIRLTPGKPEESALSYRMHTNTSYRMPKIGSSVVDPDGTSIIDDWITSIKSCP
jgi:uncharacterized repeat protein (TIGR03806 family)